MLKLPWVTIHVRISPFLVPAALPPERGKGRFLSCIRTRGGVSARTTRRTLPRARRWVAPLGLCETIRKINTLIETFTNALWVIKTGSPLRESYD